MRSGPVQLIVPVYNEGENVVVLHRKLREDAVPYDSLRFVYDRDDDTSLPYVAKLRDEDPRVDALRNQYGPGVIRALRTGFERAEPGPVIVLMGDLSDKLSIVPEMLELWRAGATVVSPSRYMPGGIQHGGGLLKSNLSRLAGKSLGWLGFPTSDPTNNFKLYDGSLAAPTDDRERRRLRGGPRALLQGVRAGPADPPAPDRVVRPHERREPLPPARLAAALPALVVEGCDRGRSGKALVDHFLIAMIDFGKPSHRSVTIVASGKSVLISRLVRRFQSARVFLGHHWFMKSMSWIRTRLGRKTTTTGSQLWVSTGK